METSVAKRYLKMTRDINYDGYSFCSEAERLAEEVIELHKCIAVYCREELGHIDFDNDDEAIIYFKAFGRDSRAGIKTPLES